MHDFHIQSDSTMDLSQEMLFRLQQSAMAVQAAVTASRRMVNESLEILQTLSQYAPQASNDGGAEQPRTGGRADKEGRGTTDSYRAAGV